MSIFYMMWLLGIRFRHNVWSFNLVVMDSSPSCPFVRSYIFLTVKFPMDCLFYFSLLRPVCFPTSKRMESYPGYPILQRHFPSITVGRSPGRGVDLVLVFSIRQLCLLVFLQNAVMSVHVNLEREAQPFSLQAIGWSCVPKLFLSDQFRQLLIN